eukprot:9855322-Lingulodinium_polyedra.AAC.1
MEAGTDTPLGDIGSGAGDHHGVGIVSRIPFRGWPNVGHRRCCQPPRLNLQDHRQFVECSEIS